MTYQEALNTSTMAEGTIKCTYAQIFDKNGELLYTIQAVSPKKWMEKLYDEYGTFTGVEEERLLNFIEATDSGFDYSLQVALVKVEGEPSTSKLVPCTLLYDTYVYLQNAILASKKIAYTHKEITLLYDKNYPRPVYTEKQGVKVEWLEVENLAQYLKKKAVTKYQGIPCLEPKIVIDGYDYKPKYKKLNELMQKHILNPSSNMFYIKPAAFDWHPLGDADTQATEPRKKKLSNSKLLLLAAFLSTFIQQ